MMELPFFGGIKVEVYLLMTGLHEPKVVTPAYQRLSAVAKAAKVFFYLRHQIKKHFHPPFARRLQRFLDRSLFTVCVCL